MAEPWDKLSSESNEAYSRFLIYRNIGPRRSLKRAYLHYLRVYDEFAGGPKRLHVPGQWHADSANNSWRDRATAWDIRNLSKYGASVAVLHVRAIAILAGKNARYAERLKPGDNGYSDLLASIRTVAEFLTPEVVRGIQEHNKPAGTAVLVTAGERAAVE